jgi:hypothetical protein
MAATKSEQFEHNENPADAGFLLSGDTTGVFATVHCTSTPVIAPNCIVSALRAKIITYVN